MAENEIQHVRTGHPPPSARPLDARHGLLTATVLLSSDLKG
ncbi:hypothetical protein [Streptomyces sp. NPDC006267]